jgi:hypothetical protein
MVNQTNPRSAPTAKPVVAGFFNIITGAGVLLTLSILTIGGLVIGAFTFPLIGFVILILGIPGLVLGILSIVGGIYATQRRKWGWALAGSIASALAANVLGIVALILVALSKDEFNNG